MRSQRDVNNSNRRNETKADILLLLAKNIIQTNRYLSVTEISRRLGYKRNNISVQMRKLSVIQGYIYRKKFENGDLKYRHLKPKGHRAAQQLYSRIKLKEIDDKVSLNLKEPLQWELRKLYEKFLDEYYTWLYSLW